MSPVALAASFGDQLLTSLAAAVPASILTVAISWQAILRRKVEARVEAHIELELARAKGSFEDKLQRRRELVMRVLEKEMLERLDEIMGSAYRARNAVRELAALGPAAGERAELVDELATHGGAFHKQVMENRIRLSALASFGEAHTLKNALLEVLRAERSGHREGLPESAALVESSFERFDVAIKEVISGEPDPTEA